MVVGEDLHQHIEVWYVGERRESRERVDYLSSRFSLSQPFPDPSGPSPRVHHAGHPLAPLAPRLWLLEAQGVLHHATDSSPVVDVVDPALPDLVGLPVEGPQVPLEDFAHQLWIFDYRELGEARVRRGQLGTRGAFPVPSRLTLGSRSLRDRGLSTVSRFPNTSAYGGCLDP